MKIFQLIKRIPESLKCYPTQEIVLIFLQFLKLIRIFKNRQPSFIQGFSNFKSANLSKPQNNFVRLNVLSVDISIHSQRGDCLLLAKLEMTYSEENLRDQ